MENKNVRICMFCRYFYPSIGGNETQALLLAKELITQGVSVMVVTSRINSTYKKEELYEGIKIYRVAELSELIRGIKKITNRFGLTKQKEAVITVANLGCREDKTHAYSKLSKLSNLINISYFKFNALRKLKAECRNYDLIHSQMLGQIGYIALRGALDNRKSILIKDATLGGLDLVNVGFNVNKQRKLLKEKANFVAISNRIYDNFIMQGIDKSRLFQISNGIDIANITNKNNFNARFGTVLFVGNFWQGEIKGLDILLRAMGKVVSKYNKVRLLIVGEGNIEHYKEIAKMAGVLDNVCFLGPVKNMDSIYRSHSIFVLPSRSEGMSNATLEAMSYGMACVVSDVSGSSDLIENGKEGLIIPIGDLTAMAKAIIEMLDDTERARLMGNAAKEKICRKFDIRIVATKYIKVYKEITNSTLSQ